MKKLTDKLKQIGKMYVAPVALVGAVVGGYYGFKEEKAVELPISQEVRDSIVTRQNIEYESKQKEVNTKLEEMTKEYNTSLDSARNKFNEYIAQGDTFTIKEQKQIFALYKQANKSVRNIKNYAKVSKQPKYSSLELPKKDAELQSLLKENLYGIDYGTPELEEALKSSGINIEVEPISSEPEGQGVPLGMAVAGIIIFLVYEICREGQEGEK